MQPSPHRVACRFASGPMVDMGPFERELRASVADLASRRGQGAKGAPSFEDLRAKAQGLLPEALVAKMRPGSGGWVREVYGALRALWRDTSSDGAFELMRLVMKWEMAQDDTGDSAAQDEDTIRNMLGQVAGQMRGVVGTVQQAIGRAHNWAGSPVRLVPEFSEGIFERLSDGRPLVGLVRLHLGRETTMTVFLDGAKVEGVEDVLEGGDTDFFNDPREQADYFALVNELRQPGSSSQGKRITLWTARPAKDRRRYLDARTLPTNIFLTNDADRAAGIAHDLGAGTIRDLWRVVMNTRDLVLTLDAGAVKDYQTISEAPIQAIELVEEGTL